MAIPRKRTWYCRLLLESSTYDVGIACVSGVAAIVKATKDGAGWFALGAGLVCILAVLKALVAIFKRSSDTSIHELEGCLHALHAFISTGRPGRWRVTIHVPVESGRQLEQLCNYIGDNERGKAGRKFPVQCGVMGHAFRCKELVVAFRQSKDYEEFIKELIKQWHYTESDARQCHPGTYSLMAIPLLGGAGGNSVEGVVYVDTTESDAFNPETIDACVALCAGIAHFVKRRYKA